MIADTKYQYAFHVLDDQALLNKGTWLVVLHASRIPPHIGLMINGNYNSLTLKERETNVRSETLFKAIAQKKIETLFVKLVKHPVFSEDYQLQTFQEQLQQFSSVKQNEATCLSPIKLFFEEFYAVRNNKEQLFFDFLETLNDNDYLSDIVGVNMKEGLGEQVFTFTTYTNAELQERIEQERKTYFK